MSSDYNREKNENRDPITKEPGAHPVGTGIGAAAGGAATGAAVGSVAGPVGTVAGIVGGAIVGGLVGKGIGEAVNPTEEEAYWRQRHSSQPFAGNRPYEDYHGAYRTGWEGYSKYGTSGRSFDESEADLRSEYERNRGKSSLTWDQARQATQAAWKKVSGNYERFIGYEVQSNDGSKIGTVHNLWTDETGRPAFLGVKTGWLGIGKNHVLPVHTGNVNDRQKIIRVPFTPDKIKEAPSFDADADLRSSEQDRVYGYYGLQRPQFRRSQQSGQNGEAAGSGLRRIDRTENEPAGAVFEVQDVFIALRSEDPDDMETESGDKPRFPSEPGAKSRSSERYEPKERGKQR
jgi:PRC-barrel domain